MMVITDEFLQQHVIFPAYEITRRECGEPLQMTGLLVGKIIDAMTMLYEDSAYTVPRDEQIQSMALQQLAAWADSRPDIAEFLGIDPQATDEGPEQAIAFLQQRWQKHLALRLK